MSTTQKKETRAHPKTGREQEVITTNVAGTPFSFVQAPPDWRVYVLRYGEQWCEISKGSAAVHALLDGHLALKRRVLRSLGWVVEDLTRRNQESYSLEGGEGDAPASDELAELCELWERLRMEVPDE